MQEYEDLGHKNESNEDANSDVITFQVTRHSGVPAVQHALVLFVTEAAFEGATAPGPGREGAPRFRRKVVVMSLSSDILR
jgi:hypothetical protein